RRLKGVSVRARYRWSRSLVGCLAAAALGAAGCNGAVRANPSVHGSTPRPATLSPSPSAAAAVDPAAVKANELGQVPVLMYHQFLAKPRGVYDQTLQQFRAELTSLYAHGYRTI